MRKDYAIVKERRSANPKTGIGLDEYAAYIVRGDIWMFHVASFFFKWQFDEFIAKLNISLSQGTEISGSKEDDKVIKYNLDKTFENESFSRMENVPSDAKPIKLISNGSVVDGFYTDVDNVITFWRPNPNFKDIYKPLGIDEHIEFVKSHGIY